VTEERSFGTLLVRHKLDNGIPQEMISCHTGEIDAFWTNAETQSVSPFPACPMDHTEWGQKISVKPTMYF
jgi:hypothetical protein